MNNYCLTMWAEEPIRCSECGKEFSDRADACPNCGGQTVIILEDMEKEKKIEKNKSFCKKNPLTFCRIGPTI